MTFLSYIKQQFMAHEMVSSNVKGLLTYSIKQQNSTLEIRLTPFNLCIIFEVSNFG